MVHTTCAGILLLALAMSVTAQTPPPQRVASAEAESHLIQKITPAVPPLAKMAKIGGTVKLHIVISPAGDVTSVNVISGHPMLVQAAIDAVRKWKYKPFMQNGAAIAVTTEVGVDFPGGMSPEESAARNKFFSAEDECRKLLKSGKYADAESKCRQAVELSNALPKDVVLERSGAKSLLANSIFLQDRFAEAIPIYEEALALDKGYREPNDADLATDYTNLGRAYAMTGALAKADGLYSTAVSTFQAAIENLPSMKENYTRRLKQTLTEYAELKEAQGQKEAAEQLRKKAAGLAD
jgi:TonB family protein